MNKLRQLNELARTPKLSVIKLTVTTKDGKSESIHATVRTNKIGKLAGPGLSGYSLHQLITDKVLEVVDASGTLHKYEVLTLEEAKREKELSSKNQNQEEVALETK